MLKNYPKIPGKLSSNCKQNVRFYRGSMKEMYSQRETDNAYANISIFYGKNVVGECVVKKLNEKLKLATVLVSTCHLYSWAPAKTSLTQDQGLFDYCFKIFIKSCPKLISYLCFI